MSGEYSDSGIRWLSCDDLVDLNKLVITSFTPGESVGVMKPALLGSSQAAPATYRYYEQCEDIATLAAVLFFSIAQNHIFNNGNKRTAFAAAIVFLRANGFKFSPPLDEALEVATGTTEGCYSRSQIAQWIADNSQPSDSADLVSNQMDIVLDIFT